MYKINILLVVSTLVSCQTSYKAKSMLDGLGYQDKKLKDDVYQILYKVNAMTPKQRALDFWHVRATELCGHSNYFAEANLSKKTNIPYRTAVYTQSATAPVHYYATTNSNGVEVYRRDPTPIFNMREPSFGNSNKFPRVNGVAYCAGKPEKLLVREPHRKTH